MNEFLWGLLRFLPPAILLIVIFAILREARHSIARFARLIRLAWSDEWHGRDRVGKCNRGGTIIWFTVAFAIFFTRELHSLIRPEHKEISIWLFLSGLAFLVISLLTLAVLEKYKMLLGSPRRFRR